MPRPNRSCLRLPVVLVCACSSGPRQAKGARDAQAWRRTATHGERKRRRHTGAPGAGARRTSPGRARLGRPNPRCRRARRTPQRAAGRGILRADLAERLGFLHSGGLLADCVPSSTRCGLPDCCASCVAKGSMWWGSRAPGAERLRRPALRASGLSCRSRRSIVGGVTHVALLASESTGFASRYAPPWTRPAGCSTPSKSRRIHGSASPGV